MNVPNPVQRSARSEFRQAARVSDDIIAPCATEGGTFRQPAPARLRGFEPYVEPIVVPPWLSAAVIVIELCIIRVFA